MRSALKISSLLLLGFIYNSAFTLVNAQCTNLKADLKKGTLNKLKPTASMAEIKAKLPCFTGDSEEGSVFNCGGGVFYLKNDFFFYSGRDYIEFRKNFNGKLSIDVMGKDVAAVESLVGKPTLKVVEGGETSYLYQKKYGTLRITFNDTGVVRIVALHGAAPADVKLCY